MQLSQRDLLVDNLVPVGLNLILLEVLEGTVAATWRWFNLPVSIESPEQKPTHVAMMEIVGFEVFSSVTADVSVDWGVRGR